ncbi:MAG: penicillin-binding protein 1C [Desulfovibrionaceae bacterium]|nr:penicillin-binding protein 1C [Desulfovibrionaceae bacterium]
MIALLPLGAFWLMLLLTPCPHPLEEKGYSRIITDRNGELLRVSLSPDQKYRIKITLDDIPPEAMEAVLEYEDRYFWLHPGVNPLAMARAGIGMLLGGRRMGGSTITMQVARLAWGLKTGSLPDKLRQIWLALHLEQHYSKAEILEAYFNLAPYGGNVEGLGAAALIYFHKEAAQLTKAESSALMLVPQNPAARRPSSGNAAFLNAVQRQWHKGEEYAPLRIFGPGELPFALPHLSSELLASPGPLRVQTTVDMIAQQRVEEALSRYSRRHGSYGLNNAAALLLHWPTMQVRALSGSADFHNAAIEGQIDGTRARRSPGSTLKPFIYALALEQGLIHPLTLMADTPRSFAGYDPENFDKSFRGPLPAGEALRASRNVPALALAARLEHPDLYEFLQRGGVKFLSDREHYGLSLVLGGAEVSMRELAALYAMLANGGVWRPLVLTAHPGEYNAQPAEGVPLLSAEAAFVVLKMLEDAASDKMLRSQGGAVLPARLKTGTSNGFRDAWAAGIFGPYVLVVWVGNFDNRSNPLLVGGLAATPLFMDIARSLALTEPMEDIFASPRPGLNVEEIEVCAATGDLDISLCSETAMSWYIPGVSPLRSSGVFRRIHIDKNTGLRACAPEAGRTEEVVWEFWPSDMAAMFERAGNPKAPPPPFEAGCASGEPVPGKAPVIRQPKEGLTYHASLSRGGVSPLPLLAHADADAGRLRWFVNGRHVGDSRPGETLIYQSGPGSLHVLVVDQVQRASVRTVNIKAVP